MNLGTAVWNRKVMKTGCTTAWSLSRKPGALTRDATRPSHCFRTPQSADSTGPAHATLHRRTHLATCCFSSHPLRTCNRRRNTPRVTFLHSAEFTQLQRSAWLGLAEVVREVATVVENSAALSSSQLLTRFFGKRHARHAGWLADNPFPRTAAFCCDVLAP